MTYDFSDIEAQPFQAMAQAIAVEVFGSGTKVFGDGPDGGREASFDGPHPSIVTHGAPWDGYGVIQAKCRRRPKRSSDDATWLITQLKKDLNKFKDARRRLRSPDYYVLITNVALSSVDTKGRNGRRIVGGKDRVDKVFSSYQSALGLKGWLVWDESELRAHLDRLDGIRLSYACWITPGDVLSAALGALKSPSSAKRILLKLAADLKADRDIKRKEARQNTEQGIALTDIFVDLPLEEQISIDFDVPFEDIIERDADTFLATSTVVVDPSLYVDLDRFGDDVFDVERPKVVREILNRSKEKLDPKSIKALRNSAHGSNKTDRNRIVVLGGPGQGKSTIGSFLAQLLRARALREQVGFETTSEVDDQITRIMNRARQQQLPITGPLRYPVRIELPIFADALSRSLATGAPFSLFDYISNEALGFKPDSDRFDLATNWLTSFPWLVILDGLDEVPSSGNRAELLNEISALWDLVHAINADILMIVSSRQQGFANDLDAKHWEHWNLAPLTPNEAMSFAERQADALISDPERRQTVLEKLKRASLDAATAPLMVSPLQVSMLFALAEVYDDIPSDRWTLFNRHYEVLRDREAAKGGVQGGVVRQLKPIIDEIHRVSGFLLHLRAELAGASDAFLTPNEFRAIVTVCLTNEDHEGDDVEALTDSLVAIATNRLVMLNARVTDRIAFDVRSLQEFMAAWCIMTGKESLFMERLRQIAPKSHWRHVLRICVSKIYGTEPRHLRRDIVSLCHSFNSSHNSRIDSIVKTGSRIAIDLIGDNISAKLSAIRGELYQISMDILTLGIDCIPDNMPSIMLKGVPNDAIKRLIRSVEGLKQPEASAAIGIILGSNNQQLWELLRETLAGVEPFPLRILAGSNYHGTAPEINRLVLDALIKVGATEASRLRALYRFLEADNRKEHSHRFRLNLADVSWAFFPPNKGRRIGISFVPLPKQGLTLADYHSEDLWALEKARIEFSRSPNKLGLSASLATIAEAKQLVGARTYNMFWPIASVIAMADTNEGLLKLSFDAKDGCFGDLPDWELAEERWSRGIEVGDLLYWEHAYIDCNIARIGAPPVNGIRREQCEEDAVYFGRFVEALKSTSHPKVKNSLLRIALLSSSPSETALNDLRYVVSYLKDTPQPSLLANSISFLNSLPDEIYNEIDTLETLNKLLMSMKTPIPRMENRELFRGVNTALTHTGLHGLAYYLFKFLIWHGDMRMREEHRVEVEQFRERIGKECFAYQDGESTYIHDLKSMGSLLYLQEEDSLDSFEWAWAGRLNAVDRRPFMLKLMTLGISLTKKAEIAEILMAHFRGNGPATKIMIAPLLALHDAVRSGFCDNVRLRDLELPTLEMLP